MKKKFRNLFIADLSCFGLSAVMIMLISVTDKLSGGPDSIFSILVAALFWIGIIAGIVVYRIIAVKVKILEEKVPGLRKKAYQRFPGILTFRLDKFRMVLYAVIVAGILLIISDMLFHYVNEVIMFGLIAITFYFIIVHCVVNSKCFRVFTMMKSSVKKDRSHKGSIS